MHKALIILTLCISVAASDTTHNASHPNNVDKATKNLMYLMCFPIAHLTIMTFIVGLSCILFNCICIIVKHVYGCLLSVITYNV